jgi:hypothetical protein
MATRTSSSGVEQILLEDAYRSKPVSYSGAVGYEFLFVIHIPSASL